MSRGKGDDNGREIHDLKLRLGVESAPEVKITSGQVAEYAYVASAQREVFHRPDCELAKKISPQNLVGFKTREDAINSGRRPCKVCKP